MCVVVVNELLAAKLESHDGGDGVRAWKRWDCTVLGSVDGGAEIKVMLKTFDAGVSKKLETFRRLHKSDKLPEPITLKVKPFESGRSISYTVYAKDNLTLFPQSRGGGGRGGATVAVVSNRQVAFKAANVLVTAGLSAGCYETPQEAAAAVLGVARGYLAFLEGS